MDVTFGDVQVWISPLAIMAVAGFWALVSIARVLWK